MSDLTDTGGGRLVEGQDQFTAFIDFSASPFALGDILTWNVRVCCEAAQAGRSSMDVVALTDPDMLGNAFQNFITRSNYLRLFMDLIPAFYTNPMLRHFHHLRDRGSFEGLMGAAESRGLPMFPGRFKYDEGLACRQGVYNRHHVMNRFFREKGWIPRLTVPPAHRVWAENFLKSQGADVFAVTVHVRRRETETHMFGAALDRDGDYEVWEAFFDEAMRRHPETRFIILGKSVEWPRRLMRRSDLVLLKTLGYGLMEELALVEASDLFMGLLSGPSTMAFFTGVPYSLFVQQGYAGLSAEVVEVAVGERALPFAAPDQVLIWEPPAFESLLDTFEEQYDAFRRR